MTKEEFEREVEELKEMLLNLPNIRDKGARKKMVREIRYIFHRILKG